MLDLKSFFKRILSSGIQTQEDRSEMKRKRRIILSPGGDANLSSEENNELSQGVVSSHSKFREPGLRLLRFRTEELETFNNLVGSERIGLFLRMDECFMQADRVLLVLVLIYFKRGNLSLEEYTEYNFWTALYIAHDIEEEVTFFKYEILPWALGENWDNEKTSFFDNKLNLFKRMNYRASVSEPTIFAVLHMLKNPQIGLRVRRDDHVGNWKREEDAHEFADPRGPYRTPEPCLRCCYNKAQRVFGDITDDEME
ncbi:speedy protein 1-A [Eurytemora carolleeae]|uniref:speedy protein 1-A n=1 Tax=Eurytemora carolleeae TaxID=1294199 RepID=UPI000C765B8E|nr:speedy protein 1-A [Eurytemora carolleeae]|eukprot:XP_023333360.1 speedy protein 1-A-like [Eurytemora affinis]